MSLTRTTTIPGVSGAVVTVTAPVFAITFPPYQAANGVDVGTLDVPAAIDAGIAAATLSPQNFGGSSLATPPAGTSGVAIDTIVGSVLFEPPTFSAVVDAEAGASTIVADATLPQSILTGGMPASLFANGGSGAGVISGALDDTIFAAPAIPRSSPRGASLNLVRVWIC
jgi:hypothetical protein